MSDEIQPRLFGDDPQAGDALVGAIVERAPVAGVRRVLWPNRTQIELRPCDLESLLPEGHRARLVWAWVERADLSADLCQHPRGGRRQRAHRHRPGDPVRPVAVCHPRGGGQCPGAGTADPRARRLPLDLRGGVGQPPHPLGLSARPMARPSMGCSPRVWRLLAEGVVSLKRVAQDGVRVRASAGAASFRRGATLEACLEEARTQVEALKRQVEDDPSAVSRRRQAARERAARERQERLERALARLPEMAEIKAKQGKPREQARVSSTDPEATVMKMADGGFRPAYNGQFTADTASQVIVGVAAATVGTDSGQLTPMREQVVERYGKHPAEWLVDGGYATHEQIEQAAAQTTVYAPVPKPRDPETDPHARKTATARRSPPGASVWPPRRPKPSTPSAPPPPNASMPWPASAVSPGCGYAGAPRCAACCSCMPSPTT
jgi:hypothetical protein